MNYASKIVSISQKRQITIPQKFFAKFNFGTQAKVSTVENGILIQPAETRSGDFDVEILKELVNKGLTGQELINSFQDYQRRVRPAVNAMITEAKRIARGEAEFYSLDEAFGED